MNELALRALWIKLLLYLACRRHPVPVTCSSGGVSIVENNTSGTFRYLVKKINLMN